MNVRINVEEKTLLVNQVLTYNNTSNDTLKYIILNDWNNAFSSKSSALAKRFSDEFIRSFHLATEKERGFTDVKNIIDSNFNPLPWSRPDGKIDLIKIELTQPILPCSKQSFTFVYSVKIPDSKFTKYGFDNDGRITLKNWYLNPARYIHKQFTQYSNENIDDIPNAFSDFEIEFELTTNYSLSSNLQEIDTLNLSNSKKIILKASNKPEAILCASQVPR